VGVKERMRFLRDVSTIMGIIGGFTLQVIPDKGMYFSILAGFIISSIVLYIHTAISAKRDYEWKTKPLSRLFSSPTFLDFFEGLFSFLLMILLLYPTISFINLLLESAHGNTLLLILDSCVSLFLVFVLSLLPFLSIEYLSRSRKVSK